MTPPTGLEMPLEGKSQVNLSEMEDLREAITRHIRYTLVRPNQGLNASDYLKPVSLAIRERLVDKLIETENRYNATDSKRLYYLSMEFLMGRSLGDNLCNLQLWEECKQ